MTKSNKTHHVLYYMLPKVFAMVLLITQLIFTTILKFLRGLIQINYVNRKRSLHSHEPMPQMMIAIEPWKNTMYYIYIRILYTYIDLGGLIQNWLLCSPCVATNANICKSKTL